MPGFGDNILVNNEIMDLEPVVREPLSYGSLWALILILCLFFAVTWVRINYPRRFVYLMRTFFENRLLRQLMRQEHILKHRSSYILLLNFCLAISLFANVSLHYFYDFPLEILRVFGGALIILVVYGVKLLSISLIRSVFGIDSGLSEYRYNVILGNEFLGIFMIPIVLAMYFSLKGYLPTFFYIGVIFIVGMYVFRILRGIVNSILNGISFYYLILYLCTLEILPLVIVLKEIERYS